VPPDVSPAAAGLQTALADAYNLITSVHPAELDAALTSLAAAIQNQGAALGKLVDQAAGYLRALAPAIPTLDAVISRFATVANELALQSPSLLQSLANLLAPAKAIVDEQQAVTQLLNIAPATADAATGLLEQTGENFVQIVTNEQPFLQALAADPGALASSIKGFGSMAAALSSTFHNGHPSINVIISGINTSGLVPLLVGQKSEIVQKLVDPTPYGSAQCPRYPGASGPNCPAGAGAGVLNDSAVIVTTGADTGGNVSSIGEPHEVAAVRALISSITGIAPGNIPDAMDLLVAPLLKNATTVISR
jgi:ABC-type transporter Mla subunit MlaD